MICGPPCVLYLNFTFRPYFAHVPDFKQYSIPAPSAEPGLK